MEFTHTFRVPVDVDTAFETLTDLERVAPCLPGATLEEVEGDTYRGRVKVKVGPISVTYRGTARLAEKDQEAKVARIEASGKEARGSGTAKADVQARLKGDGDGTEVTVVTDLTITGKPAQFGRGVMADVGSRIIDSFAERLQDMVTGGEQEPAAGEPEPATAGTPTSEGSEEEAPEPARQGGVRRIAQLPGRADDALDLMEVAGPATIKRLAPVAALLAVLGLVWWLRRR